VTATPTSPHTSAALSGGGCDTGLGLPGEPVSCTVSRLTTEPIAATFDPAYLLTLRTRATGPSADMIVGELRARDASGSVVACDHPANTPSRECRFAVPAFEQLSLRARGLEPWGDVVSRLDGEDCSSGPSIGPAPSTCGATMDRDRTYTATFVSPMRETLTAHTAGAGGDAAGAEGRVFSGTGLNCSREHGADDQGVCTYDTLAAREVTVTAIPTSPVTTAELTGACAAGPGDPGEPVSCVVTLLDAPEVTATFTRHRTGTFTCRASSARLLGVETFVANPRSTPCADRSGSFLGLLPNLGAGLTGDLLSASTSLSPDAAGSGRPSVDDAAEADASVTGLKLVVAGRTITADVVTAHAEARCTAVGEDPVLSGATRLADVRVDGERPAYVTVGGQRKFVIAGVADVYVNHTTTSGSTVIQRGLWIKGRGLLSLIDVVVAEARAGYTGHPCG